MVALATTLLLVAVLAISGLVLTWGYRPPPDDPSAWRLAHRGASVLLLPATWVLLAAGLALARSQRGRRRLWAVPGGLVLAALAAAFTGYLLPWDQAVLPGVVIGPDFQGLGVAFDDRVDALVLDGSLVDRIPYQRFVVAHLVLGAVVIVGSAAMVVRRARG